MAVVKPVILQVVGFQNSGKTTFVKNLIEELTKIDLRVATIKHHGHGGKPDVLERKDSSEHIHSGAFASLVEGEGRLLLQVEKEEWNLQEKVTLLTMMKPDVIIIEGHKKENYPKVVLLRNEADIIDLKHLDNVLAFVSRNDPIEAPAFPLKGETETIQWLINYIGNCKEE